MLAAVLFGSSYVATAFQLHGFTPLGGAFWRSVIASVALATIAAALSGSANSGAGGRAPWSAARVARLIVLGLLGGLFFVVGMNEAVLRIGAAITAFVAGLYAILAALFAPILLRERLAVRAVGGFVLALVGTALLAELSLSGRVLVGLLAGGGAAISFALYLVLVRRWSRALGTTPMEIAIAVSVVAAAGLLVDLLVFDRPALSPTHVTVEVLAATVWLAIVGAIGPLLTAAALRRIQASLASALLLLNPISATILAVLLLGERPTPLQLGGGALVLAGMALALDVAALLRGRSERVAAAQQVGTDG